MLQYTGMKKDSLLRGHSGMIFTLGAGQTTTFVYPFGLNGVENYPEGHHSVYISAGALMRTEWEEYENEYMQATFFADFTMHLNALDSVPPMLGSETPEDYYITFSLGVSPGF